MLAFCPNKKPTAANLNLTLEHIRSFELDKVYKKNPTKIVKSLDIGPIKINN